MQCFSHIAPPTPRPRSVAMGNTHMHRRSVVHVSPAAHPSLRDAPVRPCPCSPPLVLRGPREHSAIPALLALCQERVRLPGSASPTPTLQENLGNYSEDVAAASTAGAAVTEERTFQSGPSTPGLVLNAYVSTGEEGKGGERGRRSRHAGNLNHRV